MGMKINELRHKIRSFSKTELIKDVGLGGYCKVSSVIPTHTMK